MLPSLPFFRSTKTEKEIIFFKILKQEHQLNIPVVALALSMTRMSHQAKKIINFLITNAIIALSNHYFIGRVTEQSISLLSY